MFEMNVLLVGKVDASIMMSNTLEERLMEIRVWVPFAKNGFNKLDISEANYIYLLY